MTGARPVVDHAFKRTAASLGVKPFADRFAVTSTTQTLVRHVVDRFRDMVDRTVRKDELGTTLVLRLEALAGLAVLPVGATIRTCIATFP